MPLSYFWTRQGLPMPPGAVMEDHNRVLLIPNAKVEDSGNYTCHVTRQNIQNDQKSFYLSVEGMLVCIIIYAIFFFRNFIEIQTPNYKTKNHTSNTF